MQGTRCPAKNPTLLLVTVLALTACASPGTDSGPGTTVADAPPEGVLRAYVWQCEDGRKIVMRNLLRERAIIIGLPDGERRLEQTISASGVRYADSGERIVFWTKGETANLERAGATPVHCQERRAESLREDARLRGVTYRALGNEPGWILEVGPQARLDWTTNYGAEHLEFTESTATVSPDGRTRIYTAGHDANSIKVTIRSERCVDDGDNAFEYTTLVEYHGNTLRGCASRLSDK